MRLLLTLSDRNNRFPYPFKDFNYWNQYPFTVTQSKTMTKERLNSISIKFTLSCTTWPSFSFTCRLLFIISTLKLVVSWKFLSIRIVLSCFYLLIFYFEKFSTWIWRLPFAVYVKRRLEHKPQKDKEISKVSYSARENHTAKLNNPILFLTKVKDELIYGLKE